jgi:hypothetical protein
VLHFFFFLLASEAFLSWSWSFSITYYYQQFSSAWGVFSSWGMAPCSAAALAAVCSVLASGHGRGSLLGEFPPRQTA